MTRQISGPRLANGGAVSYPRPRHPSRPVLAAVIFAAWALVWLTVGWLLGALL